MIIGIDFDGTCVTHDFPRVGRYIGAEPVLCELVEAGHQLILWTMRSDDPLQDAVDWFTERKIPLYGVNVNPRQRSWTNSPKAYAQMYIDDAALGIPLISGSVGESPYVNWTLVRELLVQRGLLP